MEVDAREYNGGSLRVGAVLILEGVTIRTEVVIETFAEKP